MAITRFEINPYTPRRNALKSINIPACTFPLHKTNKDNFVYDCATKKIDLQNEYATVKGQQGIIGKIWDGFKNVFGMKNGSKNVEKIIKSAEKGEISEKEAQEAIRNYKEGQNTCVDVVADMASGILSIAAFALAVPTGGASLAIGLTASTVIGAGVKVGIKAGDAISTGKEYKRKDLLYDAATGSINGLLAPVTNGLGNTVTKTIGKKLGLKIVREGAEEVAEQAVKQTFRQTAKSVILNQTLDVAGGTMGKRALALGAGMAVDGALGGASDNMIKAALEGENVVQAGIEGAVSGAIMSPVIGGGFRVAGKAGTALNNKITTKIVLPDGINTKFKQGKTGDCALLSTIDGMMNNPATAKSFKKSINKTIAGDYTVKIGDKVVTVAKSSLSDDMLSDKTGIRIFEQAYKQLTGDIDGGFAEVVAKQFGLNPVHIANDSISDELLDKLARNKGNTVLSLGTLVDNDGSITATGSQRHYFTVRNIDADNRTVTLTSPTDTSKTIKLSYDDVKATALSIDGGTISSMDLPNANRSTGDIKFKGLSEENSEIHVCGYDVSGEEGEKIREDIRTRILMNAGLNDSALTVKDITLSDSDIKTKYSEIVRILSELQTKKGANIFENMLPTPDGKGIRCKTVLSGRNKNAINFKLKKLKENRIGTIIDLRTSGECSEVARTALNESGMRYINFPVEDKNWTKQSIEQMVGFIKAINTDNYCIGCANGQSRTDLAVAINYIFNPHTPNDVPRLYYGSQNTTRVSIQDNISQILELISQNKDIVYDLGYESYDEFLKVTKKKFDYLSNAIK